MLYHRDQEPRQNPLLMFGNPAPPKEDITVDGIDAHDVEAARKRKKRKPAWARSLTRTPYRDSAARRSVRAAERRWQKNKDESARRHLADKVAMAEVYFSRPGMKGAYEKKTWYRPKLPSGKKYRVPRYSQDCRVIRELSEQAGCSELKELPFEEAPTRSLEMKSFEAPVVPPRPKEKPKPRVKPKPVSTVSTVSKEQTGRTEKRVKQLLYSLKLPEKLAKDSNFYAKVVNPPYLDLSIERQGGRLLLTHFIDMNGDLAIDSEIELKLHSSEAGYRLEVVGYRYRSPWGERYATGSDAKKAANLMARNLIHQGFDNLSEVKVIDSSGNTVVTAQEAKPKPKAKKRRVRSKPRKKATPKKIQVNEGDAAIIAALQETARELAGA